MQYNKDQKPSIIHLLNQHAIHNGRVINCGTTESLCRVAADSRGENRTSWICMYQFWLTTGQRAWLHILIDLWIHSVAVCWINIPMHRELWLLFVEQCLLKGVEVQRILCMHATPPSCLKDMQCMAISKVVGTNNNATADDKRSEKKKCNIQLNQTCPNLQISVHAVCFLISNLTQVHKWA